MASVSIVGENIIFDCAVPEADVPWPYCGGLCSFSEQLVVCGICGGQSGTGTDYSQNTLGFPLSLAFH